MELGDRVLSLLAFARDNIRYRTVGHRRPGEAFRQAFHGEVIMLGLRQRCAVVDLLAIRRRYLDRHVVLHY